MAQDNPGASADQDDAAGDTAFDAESALSVAKQAGQTVVRSARPSRWGAVVLALAMGGLVATNGIPMGSRAWSGAMAIVYLAVLVVLTVNIVKKRRAGVHLRTSGRVWASLSVVIVVILAAVVGGSLDQVKATMPWWAYVIAGAVMVPVFYVLWHFTWDQRIKDAAP